MSQSNLCRLCLTACYDGKELYDDSEVFEVTTKYFEPTFLKLKQHLTVLCFECWCHIVDFHNFQERIQLAQRTFIDDEQAECQDDVVSLGSGSGDPSSGLCHANNYIDEDCEFISLSDDDDELAPVANASTTETGTKEVRRKTKSRKEDPICATGPISMETEPNLECVICSISYRSIDELRLHFRQEHPGQKFRFFCCQIKFGIKQSRFDEHFRLHSDPDAYRCDLCEVSFRWKITLSNHLCLKRVKSQAVGGYVCNECGITTILASQLRCHVYKHHTKRNFKCTLCPKSYTARASLDVHMTIHTGEYLYECQDCPMKFRYRTMFKAHQKQHHPS